jgi:hypothetical protein
VPAMKLTFNAAMRARDVSRPRAEHLEEAEAAEARHAGGSRSRTNEAASQPRAEDATKTPRPPSAADDERAGRPRYPRRRRGRGSR